MTMLQNANAIESGGYNINNSIRFRSSNSAYLSRTPASAGNRKTWTWSGWVKRGTLGGTSGFFLAKPVQDDTTFIGFSSDQLFLFNRVSGVSNGVVYTTQVFRDPSAWYHFVIVLDTTQATDTNRIKFYVNGSQITALQVTGWPTQNSDMYVNSTQQHIIGYRKDTNYDYFDGYLAEVNFIDGSAKTPSDFGETDTTTGVWKPKAYTGSYGTNGFYLKFSDIATTSGSNAGLGKDFSGNANYWTTNNISVTSGTTYDAMIDSPTNASSGTQPVGNYCTLNPLTSSSSSNSITSANLNCVLTTSGYIGSTFSPNSGKWYWEILYSARSGGGNELGVGISPITPTLATNWLNMFSYGVGYYGTDSGGGAGYKYISGVGTSYGSTFTLNDVIGVALDLDSLSVTFYKNNVSQGAISLSSFTTATGWVPSLANGTGTYTETFIANFGQRPFAYTPPTGFQALCTTNLPTPTILQGNKYMDATAYTGTNGSPTTQVISSNFQPDFLWFKKRSAAYDHALIDTNRGITKQLYSNLTNSEGTDSDVLTAIGSSSFTVGNSNYSNYGTLVAWTWKANGGTTSSNTQGSITSTVQANTTAGFSVVTYTGTGSVATVGHGLGVAPKMIIVKARNAGSTDWLVYHASLGATKNVRLQSTAAAATQTVMWNDTAPTSTVFTIGTNNNVNASSQTQVAYCFAAISGFSAFGSYTGNSSTDGPFIYTGFRPKFVLFKISSGSTGNWFILDTSRSTYNEAVNLLNPDTSDAAADVSPFIDILSNGIKIRRNSVGLNNSGYTYIYAAFAECPTKYALAR